MPFFRRKSRNTACKIEAACDTLSDSIITEEMCKDLHKQQKAASKLNKSLQNGLEKLTKKLRNQTDLEIELKRYQDKLDKLDHLNRMYERQTERAKEQLSLQKTQESQLKAMKEREALLRQRKRQIEDNLSVVSPSDRDLLKRIKEKEAAIQQLQQETEDLQHTFEEIQVSLQKNTNLNKQLKVLQEKENSLKDSGVKLASEIKKVKNENIMYESIIEELEAKQKTLENKNRKCLELEEEHERIEDVKKVFKLKIHHLEEKNWALSKEIQSFQTAFESKENAKAELLALKEEKALLQNNTLRLQQEIRKHKIENPFQMQAETDSLKIKLQGEKQSVQQTQQEVCALEQELQALRDAAHQNEELRVELSKLKAERRTAQNSLFKLKNEIQQLEKSRADCNVMQHKVELERENLTKEGKNLNTLQKHYRNVTIEIEALKHKIKLSGDEHQALLEEYQSLKRDLEQKTKAEVELDGLRRESSSLNNVIDTLKQKIQRQKAELQHLPGHVNSMLSGGTASSYDPQTLSRIVNDERIAVKNLKQEARDLETQLREVEESSTSQRSLRIDLQGVLAERKLVEEYNSKLKMGIQKLQNELKDKSKIEDELVAQRKVLVTLKEEEEEMEKERQSIKAEILDLQLNRSKLADEKQALSQKIQEKTSKIKMGVEAELTSLRKVSSSHKEDIEQMKQEIQRLKAELKRSVEELAFEFKDMPDALTFENLFELVEKEKFDIQKLEEEGHLLQTEIQDVKDSITLISELEEELKYLQSQKKLKQDTISKLKREILNLEEDFDGYIEIRAEVLSERETLDALTQHEQDLEEEYVKTKADVSAIREKMSKKAPLPPVLPEKTQKTVRFAGEPKRFLKEPRPQTPPSSASDSESQPETRGTRGTRASSPVFEESTAMSEKMSDLSTPKKSLLGPLPPLEAHKIKHPRRKAEEVTGFNWNPRPITPPPSASTSETSKKDFYPEVRKAPLGQLPAIKSSKKYNLW